MVFGALGLRALAGVRVKCSGQRGLRLGGCRT